MNPPSFKYIAIGDELLKGHRLNRNALSLGKMLLPYGWRLNRIVTLGDVPQDLAREIDGSEEDVIITSGGLGPTDDDKTVEALCLLLGCDRAIHPPTLRQVELKLAKSDKHTLDKARGQAYYPQKATAFLNRFGLAPLIQFEWKKNISLVCRESPKSLTDSWKI